MNILSWLLLHTYSLSGPGRQTLIIKPESDSFSVNITNLDESLAYEIRAYSTGFSFASYSPEKVFISGSSATTVQFRRTWKSDVRQLPGDQLVVTIDPLLFGLVPSAIPAVQVLVAVLAAVPTSFYFRKLIID
jgi:hypothetical protein